MDLLFSPTPSRWCSPVSLSYSGRSATLVLRSQEGETQVLPNSLEQEVERTANWNLRLYVKSVPEKQGRCFFSNRKHPGPTGSSRVPPHTLSSCIRISASLRCHVTSVWLKTKEGPRAGVGGVHHVIIYPVLFFFFFKVYIASSHKLDSHCGSFIYPPIHPSTCALIKWLVVRGLQSDGRVQSQLLYEGKS